MKRNLFIAAAISSLPLVFTACGGGGGTAVTAPTPVATPTPTVTPTPTTTPAPTAVPLQSTSYGNAKLSGWIPTDNPDDVVRANVIAYGDFHRNGQQMMLVADNTYDWKLPIEQATAGTLGFYSYNKSTNKWIKDKSLLADGVAGCIHTRKALVVDLNGDGVPDVFLACHGYDKSPFPGEKSMVLLSQSNGTYAIEQMPNVHYTHGATAFDVNGDGKIDIVEANGSQNADTVLVNDGTGHFAEHPELLPITSRQNQNYSVDAIDVNGDSKPDLIFGGNGSGINPVTNWSPNTTLLINNGSGTFASVAPVMLPVPTGLSRIALDFYANGRDLYLLETPDAYNATVVRKVNLNSMTTTDLYNVPTGDRKVQWSTFDQLWTTWMIPVNGKLVSQAKLNAMSVSIQ